MTTKNNEAYHDRGTESEIKRTADESLRLTDDGIEMPDFLRGYVGNFTIRTPSITGDMETTKHGLPDDQFYDGPIAAYPSEGDYNQDIPSGCMAISTEDHPEIVFNITDERSD